MKACGLYTPRNMKLQESPISVIRDGFELFLNESGTVLKHFRKVCFKKFGTVQKRFRILILDWFLTIPRVVLCDPFCEEVSKLSSRVYGLQHYFLPCHLFSNKITINLNMFCPPIIEWVCGNLTSKITITKKKHRLVAT